jgi:muconate cycloisomerase
MSAPLVAVETFLARYPVTGAFKYLPARGGKGPTRDTVVLRLTAEDGLCGWGQAVPSPTWSYETVETVRTTLDRHLGPALVGRDPEDLPGIEALLRQVIAPGFSTGQPIAKAAIDLALLDLAGRRAGRSVAAPWGRVGRGAVTLSWTVDAAGPAEAAAAVAAAGERGFRHFNLKVGRDPAADVAVAAEVRRAAPGAFVWADANGGYDVDTARQVAARLADLGVAALEQPLPANDLPGYRRLRAQRALPILMDEGVVALADLRAFHELDLLDGVAMKVSRCGGLTEARRILEYMEQNGLLFFASGLTDPDLAFAACLQLFGAYGLERPAALNAPQFLAGSILARPLAVRGDQALVPAGPGLGVEVDAARLAAAEIA